MSAWLVAALLAQAAPTGTLAAKAANTEGFAAYKAKDWPRAVALFRQAIAADDRHALAHYNLAATLALARQLGKTCELDAYRGTILGELAQAIALDEGRRTRALKDADFRSVQDSFRWQTLVLRRSVAKQAAQIVAAVTWYAPGQGAYGPPLTLKLGAKGRGTATRLKIGEQDAARVDEPLRWRWASGALEVTFADGKTQRFTLTEQGTLTDGAGATLSDDPSDCDA